MKCPHCDKEIPGITCPQCEAVVPESARYCMSCGSYLAPGDRGFEDEEGDLDFENRVLCPDGTCTGIIEDGKCTECGKSIQGSASRVSEEA